MLDRKQKTGIGIAAAILAALAFYFFYWVRTPVYSLNLAREAAQKHDADQFEMYVDLDSVLPGVFDDTLAAYEEISGQKLSDNALAAGVVQLVKPQVVSAMKEGVEKLIEGEKPEEDAKKSGQASEAQQMAAGMSKTILKKGLQVKDISTVSRKDGNAVVSVKVHDGKIDGDYEFHLKMKQMESGKWKVKKISNLKETVLTIDRLTKAKLAELNEPIREKIKAAAEIQDARAVDRRGDNPFFTEYWIQYRLHVQNHSGQDIRRLAVRFVLKDRNGRQLREKDARFAGIPAGKTRAMSYKDELNPFIPEEKALQGRGSRQQLQAEITAVELADGTKIALLKEIPEDADGQ